MKTYQKQNRRFYFGALISILTATIFSVCLQFVKGNVLDFAAAGDISGTVRSAALLFGFILCEIMFSYLYDRFSAGFVVGCTRAMKQDIFKSTLYRSYISFREHPQGDYLAKLTSEADTIQDRHFRMLPMLWEILFKIILVSAALFFLDYRIAIVTLVLLTTPLYIPKLIEKPLQNAQTAYLKAVEENLSMVNDWLSGFEVIKNYSIEHRIMEKFRAVNNSTMDKLLLDTQLGNISRLLTTLISYISYFVVLSCAAWLVVAGKFTAGDFFVAIGMIDQLSYPLISLAGIIRQLIAVKPACAAMEKFLTVPENKMDEQPAQKLNRVMEFKDTSFSYDGIRSILDHFNLTISKGKRYLLKGPSGCGKTTVINLLLKYFEPTAGQIEFDGIPLTELSSTYGIITVVRQEATLFRDTLRNNLTLYRDMPEDAIIAALVSVGLRRFANSQALDSIITEGGANFSGGEKKRLCLARALLRDTDVLILDEPLANLDPETIQRIEDLLLSIEDKTLLVVSHQFTEEKLHRFDQVIDFTAT